MERKIFIFILYSIQTLRCLLVPIVVMISFPLSAKVRERLSFESRNFDESLEPKREKAFAAFEVSSEGEFEQIRPIVDHLLSKGLFVEIIYASISLELKMIKLAKAATHLRILRLPVLSYGPFPNSFLQTQSLGSWLTAPRLILCRYDFYPELLLYGLKKDVQLSLVSATLKNKENPGWFLKNIYKLFSNILCATKEDELKVKSLLPANSRVKTYEFRVLQIIERIEAKEQKLAKLGEVLTWLKEVPLQKRIVFGSVWANETEVFTDSSFCMEIINENLRVVLLPHQINPQIQESIKTVPVYTYKDGDDPSELFLKMKEKPGILILEVHGLLCELYSLFGHSFIGGGHGRSVHSVLEPYFSDCHIYCGPKTHRSTEIDFVKSNSPESLSIIEDIGDFYQVFLKTSSQHKTHTRQELGRGLYSEFDNMVEFLMGESLK